MPAKKPKTMRVRYVIPMATADKAISIGTEAEVDAAEGARLIEAGFAEAVAAPTAGRRKATA